MNVAVPVTYLCHGHGERGTLVALLYQYTNTTQLYEYYHTVLSYILCVDAVNEEMASELRSDGSKGGKTRQNPVNVHDNYSSSVTCNMGAEKEEETGIVVYHMAPRSSVSVVHLAKFERSVLSWWKFNIIC